MNLSTRITRRTAGIGVAAALTGIAVTRISDAQTPDSSPDTASPVASPVAFPEGPLGAHLQWLQDALNAEGGVSTEDVAAHLSPEFLKEISAENIAEQITALGAEGGPYAIDAMTMIMTMDFPPSNASFTIIGETGGVIHGGMSIDRESGLLGGFVLEWAPPYTPDATPRG